MTFDPSKYHVVFESGETKLYAPIQPQDYHISRYIEMNAQMIYASAGCTKDVISQTVEQILEWVNSDQQLKSFRTDVGVLCNNLKYRMKYPVDQDASIRLGATMCFMEGEDPNTCTGYWLTEKMKLAKANPDIYAFFLTMGIQWQRTSEQSSDTLINETYFKDREANLQALSLLKP